jgi:hypothetical protein
MRSRLTSVGYAVDYVIYGNHVTRSLRRTVDQPLSISVVVSDVYDRMERDCGVRKH